MSFKVQITTDPVSGQLVAKDPTTGEALPYVAGMKLDPGEGNRPPVLFLGVYDFTATFDIGPTPAPTPTPTPSPTPTPTPSPTPTPTPTPAPT